jgi:two-component system nitrogen regulation sensor histidine kinase GlnL
MPRFAPGELGGLLDGVSTCIVWLDIDATVLYLNEPAEDFFGVSRNQVGGRPLKDLLRHNEELDGVIGRARASGAQYSRRELSIESLPGAASRIVDVTVTPFDAPGRPGGVIVEIADVTQHQRILRENALLTQLGGSRAMVRQLAHEIKNPLGGLRGAAQLLERELKDRSLHEYTSVIISEADRLAALVDALLGPGQPPRKEPVNIHEIVQHVGHLLAGGAVRVSIERLRPGLPRLRLDRNQLIQALLNPGRNAVQSVNQRDGSFCAHAHEYEHRQPATPRCRDIRSRTTARGGVPADSGHDFTAHHGSASGTGSVGRRISRPARRADRPSAARAHHLPILAALT